MRQETRQWTRRKLNQADMRNAYRTGFSVVKLILCPACADIVRLVVGQIRLCSCKKSSGSYDDNGKTARVDGLAIPIGIDNNSLSHAIRRWRNSGVSESFTAFVYPRGARVRLGQDKS